MEPRKAVVIRLAVAVATILACAFLIAFAPRGFAPSRAVSLSTTTTTRASSAPVVYGKLKEVELSALFEEFKSTFARSYRDDAEEAERFKVFVAFLAVVDARNAAEQAAGGTATHGVTRFADLSQEEFKAAYLSSYRRRDGASTAVMKATHVGASRPNKGASEVNWAGIYTSSPRDQGRCGSCWAFAAVEQVQSDGVREGHLDLSQELSVQQVLDCDNKSNGFKTDDEACDGGDPYNALRYAEQSDGLTTEDIYPYTSYFTSPDRATAFDSSKSVKKQCKQLEKESVIAVKSFHKLSSEDDMVTYVTSTGPLLVCVNADAWSSYTGGVMATCGTEVDHCVQVVGYSSAGNYWIIRNEWGTSWGLKGYLYLSAGQNLCNIADEAMYTKTAKA